VDYHEDTTAELFEQWFKNCLIPNLPQNSVIVMDNASYHSRQLHKSPSANNTKIEIQNYLLENDIYFEESYLKNELLEVLKSFSIKKVYVCDALAEDMGHTVLRLPPYYCLFNPIEHMWHQLKSNVRSQNVSPTLSGSVVELIRKCVDDISPESWKNSVRHVMNVENSYVTLNHIIKSIVINLEEDSDSETELGI
jgi:transposase